MFIRKSSQVVLPVHKPETGKNQYDIYPAHDLGQGKIASDFRSLARRIAGKKKVTIDGYVGVRFDLFVNELNRALCDEGIQPLWWRVDAALLPSGEIDRKIAPWLGGDDPIFGFRTSMQLKDMFDEDKLKAIRPDPAADMNIIVGSGAALAGWDGELIYIDIPKNEIQYRARAGSIANLGASGSEAPKKMYKRFYFVDWIVLNRHKKTLLPKIDIIVDGQREKEITWAEGADLREGLERMAGNGFRVRPWFEPGAWGGQWIREHIEALPDDVPNYAWSFELIVPENGLIFSSDGRMLEVSFDMAMYGNGERIVGRECYGEYGDEFPLRMDYLDNFDGGNLSIQCHPQRDYIRRNFGEVLTQEETYYVLDTTPGAVVYLGMSENADPKEFERTLCESADKGIELDVPRYINAEPSVKHGLYLIPPGTLHSSGAGNLVLEISTTPYIFTFKMYDWLAVDLDGKPRPLNIARAMDNLCSDRRGEAVRRDLVSHPVLMEKGADWELWHLPTHPKHSYDIHRYTVHSSVEVKTGGRCHVLNLVEGESVEIETAGKEHFHLNYAETLVISAAADSYRIVNSSGRPIMIVKAFMKCGPDEKQTIW